MREGIGVRRKERQEKRDLDKYYLEDVPKVRRDREHLHDNVLVADLRLVRQFQIRLEG